jgi:methylated-DNA-[protein]-cysteine S-methyltransferase
MQSEPLRYTYLASPVGDLLVAGAEDTVHYVSFPGGHKAFRPRLDWRRDDAVCAEARRQLTAYFARDLKRFDLPLHLGGTEFQRRVWRALADIPFGETRTYGWQAKVIGVAVSAARAVGAANGANPVPIILPCHRVIGATGALTGFGGGIETKKFLLELEGVAVKPGRDARQLSLL